MSTLAGAPHSCGRRVQPACSTAGAVQLRCSLLQAAIVLCRSQLLTVPPCKEGKALRSVLPALQVVDSDKFIESNLPRTKEMLEGFLTNPATSKKTPLAILHEYATRMSLEVGASVLYALCRHASPSCTPRPLSEANGPLVDWHSLGSGM